MVKPTERALTPDAVMSSEKRSGLQRTRKENLVPIQQECRVKRPDMHTDYESSHPDKSAAAYARNRDKIKPVDMVFGINHRFPNV